MGKYVGFDPNYVIGIVEIGDVMEVLHTVILIGDYYFLVTLPIGVVCRGANGELTIIPQLYS